jgi:hypothetical protein
VPSSPTSAAIICFGEFEADLRSRELRRNGARVRLPDQAFLVLAILLERPGELATREEIQKELWPSDTFVDFDHGLCRFLSGAAKRQDGVAMARNFSIWLRTTCLLLFRWRIGVPRWSLGQRVRCFASTQGFST